jgi:hypothetical protein
LTERVRRSQKAAQRAAREASGEYWRNDRPKKYDNHELTWDLLSCIGLLLGQAELSPDDTITDSARLTQIYNIACYADAFVDIALKACTLSEATASTSTNHYDAETKALQPTGGLVH